MTAGHPAWTWSDRLSRLDPRGWPWWLPALTVYAASRVLSTVALIIVLRSQEATAAMPQPSLPTFLGAWYDGTWYREVAEHGYPRVLPVDASGAVTQNAWAFLPLYPALVRSLMVLTGGGWTLVAPLVSTLLGAVAVLLVHRVVTLGAPVAVAARPGLPLATVALLSVYPASLVLQAGYAESLALLLIALALLLVVLRRYLWTVPVALALGITRPVALPLVLVIVVHGAVRWRAARSGADTWDRQVVTRLTVLAGAAAVSGVAWPVICGWVTGVGDGYVRTQQAWRGGRPIGPFEGWGPAVAGDPGKLLPTVALAVVVVGLLASPAARRLGPELYAWSVGYLGYLAAVLEPTSSLIRFGLLAFPLVAAVVGIIHGRRGRARAWTVLVLLGSFVGQVLWLWWVWRYTPGDAWTPSP